MIYKKIVSLFLVIAFYCTLAVTAESRSTKSSSESSTDLVRAEAEPAPNFREAEREKEIAKPAKKFPWLLVGGIVAGAAVAALLVFTVFKKKDYDIRGTWEVTLLVNSEAPVVDNFVFSGTKTDGDYHASANGYGDYHVEEKKVQFGYATHGTLWNYNGAFTDPENMGGTYTFDTVWSQPISISGTWTAKKISSATEIEKIGPHRACK